MSAQTGIPTPSGPSSKRFVDRARFRLLRWEAAPNPLWIRELKQATRLARTPIILCVVAIIATLVLSSLGGVMASTESPAETGAILYQVFFSIAWFVVTLAGPAVAANSIASEREGRTWEAVLLTGLSPTTIARGKLLAAYTAIALYIVMLAPVGAIPFLFGGVSAIEVVLGYVYLFAIAFISVAFGLALSSKMESLRAALLVTLLIAFPLSGLAFGTLGVGLSYAANEAWTGVMEGAPVWLPTAYDRAPLDLRYVVFLLVLPLIALFVPAYFLYEVTVANLKSSADDRSTGIKRWFLLSTPLLAFGAVLPHVVIRDRATVGVSILGLCAIAIYLFLSVFLLMGDPLGPSRRVRIQWARNNASRFARFLGPSTSSASTLLLATGVLTIGAVTLLGLIAADSADLSSYTPREDILAQVGFFGLYTAGFYTFLAGFGGYLRVRAATVLLARVLLFTTLFAVSVGPWVVAAVLGVLSGQSGNEALFIASPSPFYVFVMLDAVGRIGQEDVLLTCSIASIAWASLGLVFDVVARRRGALLLAEHEARVAAAERALDLDSAE